MHARPVVEADLSLVQDVPGQPVQVLRRAISIQIMLHLGGFQTGKGQDLLILLKLVPGGECGERFDEFVK